MVEPGISITKGSNFRFILGYQITDKKNSREEQEKSVSITRNTEIKYNILQSTSILGKFTFNNITFNSKTQSRIPIHLCLYHAGWIVAGKEFSLDT